MSTNGHHSLTIMLLKDGLGSFDDAIGKDVRAEKHEIAENGRLIGTLYVKPAFPHPPKWASFFEKFIDPDTIGKNAAVAAALLIQREARIFAVTFGPGRYLLKPDCWVERFGLVVALNSIGTEKIRTIDKTTFDAISRHSREQGSKETDVRDFGLDIEQDLLRAVTGVPKKAEIGKKIYGMDSLTVATNTRLDEIEEYLGKIYALFTDDSYKRDFPWIDHIGEVKDKAVIGDLNALLTAQIAAGKIDKVWMAVPEIIQWDQVGGFCYKMHEKYPEFLDIHLPDFLKSLSEDEKQNLDRETFTRKHVYCIHTEGYLMHEWRAYNCLYCELEKGGETFLLSGGKWYVVAGDFVDSVNRAYQAIPKYEVNLPVFRDDSEGKYNERVAAEMAGRFALMHEKIILHGGGQSKVEFCDLYSLDCDIIHVKRYGASSVFSHLFAQGRSSGELFQMDPEFREKVSRELPDGFKIQDTAQRPETNRYQVVYAIISDIPGELDIPFFSRLNMKNSARSLFSMGYRVAELKIDVDVGKARFQRFRKRRKTK